MATSKRCCVFVGNIPYDATEEQLKQICEEVGPVISFRLVVDKESGKPKGYGFCEYKDDETALSARRNLQGYGIGGRHLRVDFAENDKNSDKSRDQVRGGSISEIPKQDEVREDSATFSVVPPSASGSMMEGSLGVSHIGSSSSPDLLMPGICSDPLTIYLSKMSKNELSEVISDVKGMTSENMKLAGNILSRNPQLTEALYQAQIMLGMVTPQQKSLDMHSSSISYEQRTCKSSVQLLPSVSVLHGGNVQSGVMPAEKKMAEFSQSQFPKTYDPTQLQFTINHSNNMFSETSMSVISVPSTLSSNTRYQSAFPVISKAMSTASPHQMQPFLPPFPHNPVFPGQPRQPMEASSFMHMPTEETKLTMPYSSQPWRNTPTETGGDCYESIKITSVPTHLNWREGHLIRKATDISDSCFHPSKLHKIESGMHTSFSPAFTQTSATVPPPNLNQVTSFDMSNKFMQQIEIPPELERVLLKQVVKLTPDQLSSLPPDQQQQVILLQHMLQ